MKTEFKIPVIRKTSNHRSIEAKAKVVPAWTPHPNPLTREEIRKIVIEQIG